MGRFILSALLVGAIVHSAAANYQLTKEYSGQNFFDGWQFFSQQDPTSGFVRYQTQADAVSQGLISIQANGSDSGQTQAFMGVDFTHVTPDGRPSVRIESKDTYNHALVIADFAHAPGGICGTWPAFWLLGKDPWPQYGEIDIVEGVHEQQNNAMTLHTQTGMLLSSEKAISSSFSGQIETHDCDVKAKNQPDNAGCTIKDDSNLSFGSGFNQQGGGVYATQWTSSFIKIWFFPRDNVPQDISGGTPSPDTWGKPSSIFGGGIDLDKYFKDMKIIFDTTFCGAWAGATWKASSCATKAPTCDEYVRDNPGAFSEAYWLVNYVKVFSNVGGATATSSAVVTSTDTTSHRPHRTQTLTITVSQPAVVTSSSASPLSMSPSDSRSTFSTNDQSSRPPKHTRTSPDASTSITTTIVSSSPSSTRIITLSALKTPVRFGGAVLPVTA